MLKLIATYRYRHTRKDHEAAMMNKETLRQRHMATWARSAQVSARCIEMRQQQDFDKDDPEYQAVRTTLMAELTALMELSVQLDKATGRLETIYTHGAHAMLKACSVTQEEMKSYQRALADQRAAQEN
jgi:hypothetical protein